MPLRKIPIVRGEIYHIYNRSVAKEPIFDSSKHIKRALQILQFYSFDNLPMRFSHFIRLNNNNKKKVWKEMIENNSRRIEIFAFCLMPNHFHFLLEEIRDNGISSFISTFQNSFAKYFNTKLGRNGALFQLMFKAKRVETDEQFIHLARYIHLNPLTSYLVRNFQDLKNYQGSSLPDYLGIRKLKVINKDFLLNFFKSVQKLEDFTYNQIDYQRKLARIKYLMID